MVAISFAGISLLRVVPTMKTTKTMWKVVSAIPTQPLTQPGNGRSVTGYSVGATLDIGQSEVAENQGRNGRRSAQKQDPAHVAGNRFVAALRRRPILLRCGNLRHRLRHAAVRAQRHKINQVSAAVCTLLQSSGPPA
jgi:hypothetical protein